MCRAGCAGLLAAVAHRASFKKEFKKEFYSGRRTTAEKFVKQRNCKVCVVFEVGNLM